MIVVQMIDRLKRGGGAESLVYNFAKEARSCGIECHIVTIRNNDTAMAQELAQVGVSVHAVPGHRLINPVRLWRIFRYLKSLKPHVVHTHLTGATILGVIASRFINSAVVVSLHNVKVESDEHLFHGKLENWLMKNWTNHIIAVGQRTFTAHARKAGNTPMSIVLNAVGKPDYLKKSEIQEIRGRLFPGYNGLVIVSVGSLTEQKGYANLVEALTAVTSEFRCMIIGDGPLREDLKELVHSAGLEKKIVFMGLRSDVNRLLQVGDIYVSSSLWEGLPVATLEAMYTGLPVISTAVGDAEAILGDGTGILVNAGDNGSLAQAISGLLENENLRDELADKSFKKVDSEFNINTWMDKLKLVYQSVQA